MFLNKVHSVAQRNLFTQLNGLYEKDIAFLQQNPSISYYIMDVFCKTRLSVCTDERTLISKVMLDIELYTEIYTCDVVPPNINLPTFIKYLSLEEQLIRSLLRQCQVPMLQKLTTTVLRRSAFVLHEMYSNTSGGNKHMYIAGKRSCYMLKLAATFGYVSGLLNIAMYFNKTFRHREFLSVIYMTKVKLAQPGLMYRNM